MAQILVADTDVDIRSTLALCLRDEGHIVTMAADGIKTLALLWGSPEPLIVLMNERLAERTGLQVLAAVAGDKSDRLSRHRYIVMTTVPTALPAPSQRLLRRMAVPLVPLPFDLDNLLDLVDRVGATIHSRRLAERGSSTPKGVTTMAAGARYDPTPVRQGQA